MNPGSLEQQRQANYAYGVKDIMPNPPKAGSAAATPLAAYFQIRGQFAAQSRLGPRSGRGRIVLASYFLPTGDVVRDCL
jgi:hypothetical protein